MYLKRLDLQGFKSFPEKVKLEFNKGITSVVGPNGSGKSNISDSVRWVLGEQRAKSLRGEKMEDVIFAGTANRKPLGFAEVSITIDNQDNKMPLEYTEITITRRVFRSGESEYLINGTNCRLKDVHELFMDTGVGREGYSIIGQGRIDEILSSKNDDRRRLFEEAAGIVKYKNRRLEALTKIEREKQNLVRVEDIISELEGQIEPLSVQAETAKKYMSLKERLKEYEISLFRVRADKIEEEIIDIEKNYLIVSENIQEQTTIHLAGKERCRVLKEKVDTFTDEIQNINNVIIEIRTKVEKNEGNIKLTQEQSENIRLNIERINKDIDDKLNKIKESNNEIEIIQSRYNATDLNIHSENEKLRVKEEEFDKLSSTLLQSETHIDEYKADMIEKIKITTDVKSSLQRSMGMLEQFNSRKEQLLGEKDYINSQINDTNVHISASEKKIQFNEEEEKNITKNIHRLNLEKEVLNEKINNSSKNLEFKKRVLNENQSRFNILSEMEREHEGFFKSVKAVLKLKEGGNPKWQGIHGAVGELLQVDKKYETAIEIAFGGSIQNIVTSNENDAKLAIGYLKSNNLGRATFLPLTAIKAKTFGDDKNKILSENGVIGIASDLVKFDKIYESIMLSILGKVVIVDNIDNAVDISKKFKQTLKIVTLEGDVLNPGGAMTGGSMAKKASNVFGRSREIKELNIVLENITVEVNELNIELDKIQNKLDECNSEETMYNMKSQEARINIISAMADIEHTKQSLASLNEKLGNYIVEEGQLNEQREYTSKSIDEYNAKLDEMNLEILEIDNKLSVFQDSIQNEKYSKDEILGSITELKINISNLYQSQQSLLENIKRINSNIKDFNIEIENLKAEIEILIENRKLKNNEIININEMVLNFKVSQNEKQNLLSEITDRRKEFSLELSKTEEELQYRFETISQLKNDIFRLETKKEKIIEEKNGLYDNMWEEYEVTYQMSKQHEVSDISILQLQKYSKDLKSEIKSLGSVNVNALTEYKEVKERYEFLFKQKEDIIKAEEQLKGIVSELSELMEKQFIEQFQIISENFNIVFQEMFGGGKAYLKLSDDESALEAGIEIIAQPPGKNLQNMMLLSGGERALTAIAILFSILKMKPSPFCILDEIEAALDDANVKRFASYLKRFSGDTQFIVITHRKGTMEAADVMYGVTMQEQGVSKLVSVKFEEEVV